jgi:hypothetical protein
MARLSVDDDLQAHHHVGLGRLVVDLTPPRSRGERRTHVAREGLGCHCMTAATRLMTLIPHGLAATLLAASHGSGAEDICASPTIGRERAVRRGRTHRSLPTPERGDLPDFGTEPGGGSSLGYIATGVSQQSSPRDTPDSSIFAIRVITALGGAAGTGDLPRTGAARAAHVRAWAAGSARSREDDRQASKRDKAPGSPTPPR